MKLLNLPKILFGCLLAGSACLSIQGDTWSRFRGAAGDGVATGQKLPTKIDLKSHLVYKVKLGGNGNGSPVLWN
ncbi:MAG: hypothetical protein DWI07_02230, partial [Planctomycetota bacterium]